MKEPLHFLVIHGEGFENPLSYVVAEELSRLGAVHFTHLQTPPDEEVRGSTFVLMDHPHVVRWRRQPPNFADAQPWMRTALTCYCIGSKITESLATSSLAIKCDALDFVSGFEISVAPRSAQISAASPS